MRAHAIPSPSPTASSPPMDYFVLHGYQITISDILTIIAIIVTVILGYRTIRLARRQIDLMNRQTKLMEETLPFTERAVKVAEDEMDLVKEQLRIAQDEVKAGQRRASLYLTSDGIHEHFSGPKFGDARRVFDSATMTIWLHNIGDRTAHDCNVTLGLPVPYQIALEERHLWQLEDDKPFVTPFYTFFSRLFPGITTFRDVSQSLGITLITRDVAIQPGLEEVRPVLYRLVYEDGATPVERYTYHPLKPHFDRQVFSGV